jgi:hypothetical protein
VLAAEEAELRVYALDPGDMRTRMQADAFPGEDLSDRPEPETVLPALHRLIDGDLPSGRYTAAGLSPAAATGPGRDTPAGAPVTAAGPQPHPDASAAAPAVGAAPGAAR